MNRFALVLALLAAGLAGADERILGYHSDILVNQDGSLEVTETITVRAEGVQIRRGIYRDYPIRYEDRFGNDYDVRFEPLTVLRNGQSEDWHTERRGDGVRTYFGSSNRYLEQGEHRYEFRYRLNRMLGYFDQHDELYFNVTGTGWDFPIDEASAAVRFAFDVPGDALKLEGYTGPFGALGNDYSASVDDTIGGARFRVTRPLGQREGLTIVVGWPKGYVDEPSDMQRLVWLLSDNINLLIALAGLLAMLGYYIPVWKSHGKDPEPGVVFTRYEPPDGFSPASLRYISNMGYDHKAMTAAIVNLAVKGYLRISEADDVHSLKKLDPGPDAPPLAAGERELFEELFRNGNHIGLVNENHERIGGAQKAHKRSLKKDYHKKYFRTNGLLNLPPLLIAIIASLVALRVGPSPMVVVTIVMMVGTLITFAIIMKQPTGLGRRLMDEVDGFREYLEIAEKDEMNLRNPPEKTPQLFEAYLPFAMALNVEQQWGERFARLFATLKGPDGGAYHPGWYNGSWNSLDLSANTSSLASGLGDSISTSVSPPGSSSGGGGGGFSGGGGGGGGGGGW